MHRARPSTPWWDSWTMLVALVLVTVTSMVSAIVLQHRWIQRQLVAEAAAARQVRLTPPRAPVSPIPASLVDVKLTDLEPIEIPDAPEGGLGRNRLPEGGSFPPARREPGWGLAMRPGPNGTASVIYALNRRFETFMVVISAGGLSGHREGNARFHVEVDGRRLYSSGITRDGARLEVAVSVTGGDRLKLIVDDAGDGREFDYALWIQPRLTRPSTP